MCSSILKFLPILVDHQVTAHGVGARHRKFRMSAGGGGYLDNYTSFELSLSAQEIEAAMACLPLAPHWRLIADELGTELWLQLWRQLETLRTERQLRIEIPTLKLELLELSDDKFEQWLDAQSLSAAFFEIYFVVSASQYRFIWQTLFEAAQRPNRKQLRVYVPALKSWTLHLEKILLTELLAHKVAKPTVKKQLFYWLGRTTSDTRLNRLRRHIESSLPSQRLQ
ncbi:hypothetical protein [Vibrio sp. ER1A]|uniref:hypothetical protein n=1 Tax=Vibrio sp. ER1A TaxID=1517681 RepID=UPI00068DAB2F|nr:hypothetical protein [Vibrio sp. ER1A]